MENKHCKNCGNEVSHQFCSYCGQKTSVEALSLKRLFKELSDNVFQINHGLFFSLIEFTLRPAQSINNYLLGRRKQYFQPIAYAFTLATFYFLLSRLIDVSTIVDEIIDGYLLAAEQKNSDINQFSLQTISWFTGNYAYTMLLLVPFFALASWLVFFKQKRNYLEHLVLNLYVTGHQSIIYSVFAVIGLFVNYKDVSQSIAFCLSIVYCIVVFTQFFKKSHFTIRILQCFFVYLIYFVFFVVLIVSMLLITNKM